ncbi:STAS domain-containing protein [Streptomyces sp. NPDC005227]|uniref:STAS domain-containing protein n=1 Tax=Streptomyces sp. NPDC005227 TaxID=3364707 RepID=UPI0036A2D45D
MATDDAGTTPIPVIRPVGDLDFATIEPFAEELQQLSTRHRAVIVDLADVTFGDSTFLNTIISAEKLTELRLVNIPDVIDRVFTITAMYDILNLYPALDAAQKAPLRSDGTP